MKKASQKREMLIKLRKERGYTQKDMAQKLNISRSCYGNYETGCRKINFRCILELKKILNISDDKFFL